VNCGSDRRGEEVEQTPDQLEQEKRIANLQLENKQLEFATSDAGRRLEWLKALVGPTAIASLMVTLVVAYQQLSNLAQTRDVERFDRAVGRLGSLNVSERLTGLTALQNFLQSDDQSFDGPALLFLVNAAAVENDPTARSAILDTFRDLSRYQTSQKVLNVTLAAARDRNRGILRNLQQQFEQRIGEDNSTLLSKYDEAWIGNLRPEDTAPLRATSAVMASLVQNGGYVDDLSRIYCIECNFSTHARPANLAGVNFDRSYLRKAEFFSANLEGASFNNAQLMQADFTNANLAHAKLTSDPLGDPPVQAILSRKALWEAIGPIFECSNLEGADFTDSVLFGFYWTEVYGDAYFSRFSGANLKGAKLKKFKLFTATPFDRRKKPEHIRSQNGFEVRFTQSGAYGIPVVGHGKVPFDITVYSVDETFEFIGKMSDPPWRGVYASLRSLMSAKNIWEADMPDGLRRFLVANEKTLSRTSSTNCDAFRRKEAKAH
jgi:uncharacterized protein YjbI with pentapeptide repeats